MRIWSNMGHVRITCRWVSWLPALEAMCLYDYGHCRCIMDATDGWISGCPEKHADLVKAADSCQPVGWLQSGVASRNSRHRLVPCVTLSQHLQAFPFYWPWRFSFLAFLCISSPFKQRWRQFYYSVPLLHWSYCTAAQALISCHAHTTR